MELNGVTSPKGWADALRVAFIYLYLYMGYTTVCSVFMFVQGG